MARRNGLSGVLPFGGASSCLASGEKIKPLLRARDFRAVVRARWAVQLGRVVYSCPRASRASLIGESIKSTEKRTGQLVGAKGHLIFGNVGASGLFPLINAFADVES